MNNQFPTTLLFLLAATVLFSQSACIEKKGIQFEEQLTWDQVLQKARSTNKYIFVDVYATWCGPCKMMDQNVYPDEKLGVAMHDKFIAVKMQMDTGVNDPAFVKSRYAAARRLSNSYKVPAFPAYLFFAPDGQLVLKEFGYRNLDQFTTMLDRALAPENLLLPARISDFRKGKITYPSLGQLSMMVTNLLDNKSLADSMAKNYNEYLNTQPDSIVFTGESLIFMKNFLSLVDPADKLFQVVYNYPEKTDQGMGAGWAGYHLSEIIKRTYIEDQLLQNDKPVVANPDWNKIETSINSKYEKIDAKLLVLEYQVGYYDRMVRDWLRWSKALDEKIEKYPPQKDEQAFKELNDHAWAAFLKCNDRTVLATALKWADLCIQLNEDPVQEMDTRANLLYKLGRIAEAIQQEQAAIDAAMALVKNKSLPETRFNIPVMQTSLEQMKTKEPTCLDQGAIWAENTMPGK